MRVEGAIVGFIKYCENMTKTTKFWKGVRQSKKP